MPTQRIEEIKRRAKWHIQAVLIIAVIVTLLPIIWVLLTSFKPNTLITESKPLWVFKPTLEHYKSLLTQRGDFDFPKFITNSFIITIATTVFAIIIAYPAAYSIARFKTLGDNFSFWVLTQRMLPPIIFIIPLSILFAMYGLSDTRLGLIIIYLTFNVPFATWIFKSFIEDIPPDLERAAYMDGYSQFQVMTRIIMPLTRSAVVAVTIICFIFSWNEFLFALIISFFKSQTLTVGAAQFVTGYAIRWGKISAATIIAIIPTIVVGFIGQRYLVRGLTMGAVK
jgi:multiple sugar transport system permease protein